MKYKMPDWVGLLAVAAMGIMILVASKVAVKDSVDVSAPAQEVKRQIKTVYDPLGRPVNQARDAKGYHRVRGTANLVNGIDTITLNTGTADGRQDVSFLADSTYHGRAWTMSSGDTVRYWIIPISATQFIIKASDTVTGTVRYQVEGE